MTRVLALARRRTPAPVDRPSTSWRAGLLGALVLFLALPTASGAQIVRGLVVDDATGEPIATVEVRLLDTDEAELRRTPTDGEGRFIIRAPAPGSYLLRLSRIGYQTTTSDTLHLPSAEEAVEVTLRLGVEAVALDALTIVTRSSLVHDASYDGLYARHATTPPVGSAKVFVKGDAWFEASIKPSDLLGMTPVVHRCLEGIPIVFWHGFRVLHPVRAESLLDGAIDYLEGMEIYTSWHSLPIDFRLQLEDVIAGAVRECGVVALWPRRPDYPR